MAGWPARSAGHAGASRGMSLVFAASPFRRHAEAFPGVAGGAGGGAKPRRPKRQEVGTLNSAYWMAMRTAPPVKLPLVAVMTTGVGL